MLQRYNDSPQTGVLHLMRMNEHLDFYTIEGEKQLQYNKTFSKMNFYDSFQRFMTAGTQLLR